MNYSEAKDIVLDTIGDRNLEDHLLTFFMDQGRREIETRGNYYWMIGDKSFDLVQGTQGYSITGTAGDPTNLGITKFKQARFFRGRSLGAIDWFPIRIKGLEESAILNKKPGKPEFAVIDNESLYFFPEIPDKTYNIRFHYFQWTSYPTTGNTATDELLTRWPQAVIFAASMVGIVQKTKDSLAAKPYADLLQNELDKIQFYSDERLKVPDIRRIIPIKPAQAAGGEG